MSKMMDECFRARMNVLTGRFPLQEFREAFVKEYERKGVVLIQGATINMLGQQMTTDELSGIVFSCDRHVRTALRLVERWGFQVERRENPIDNGINLPGYFVTIPQDYLRRRMSSEVLGRMHTRDRNALHRETPEAREHLEGQRFVI